jgi:hypothetical protein
MSEIKRTNETESYSTTADWLQEFINKMARSSPPAPPTVTTASREKFATIEDKMEDIKLRVGFGSIKKITKESEPSLIAESSKKCNCIKKDGKCNCSKDKKIDKEKINSLKNILKYISDMIVSEPHLLEPEIRSRCIENKDLGFESLKIRPTKLKKFIDKKRGNNSSVSEVIYIKPDTGSASSEEDIADYFRHGMPPSR